MVGICFRSAHLAWQRSESTRTNFPIYCAVSGVFLGISLPIIPSFLIPIRSAERADLSLAPVSALLLSVALHLPFNPLRIGLQSFSPNRHVAPCAFFALPQVTIGHSGVSVKIRKVLFDSAFETSLHDSILNPKRRETTIKMGFLKNPRPSPDRAQEEVQRDETPAPPVSLQTVEPAFRQDA